MLAWLFMIATQGVLALLQAAAFVVFFKCKGFRYLSQEGWGRLNR